MRESELETQDDPNDPLLRALARAPAVLPFTGTPRYEVKRCVGEGGFGVVYEVEDRQLGRRLALKTLRPEGSGFAANIRRLKREFRSVADLVHPNLVGLHELSSDGGRWFFTMELVRGIDFLEHVCGEAAAYARTEPDVPVRRRDTSGILSEPRLRASLRQLVAGVDALHEVGIIHRDLKPSNVLVEAGGRVVILDFGLASGDLAADTDVSMRVAGTPIYMAPEQAAGKPLTPAADFYAIGVMLYEALAGRAPFEDEKSHVALLNAKLTRDPEPPSSYLRVPADLEAMCVALLRRDPAERPTARELLESLGDASQASVRSRRPASELPFVGRARELTVLRERYQATRRGEARLVRVEGQPGVGKSALLARLVQELADAGDVAVLAGRCHERESVPFKAFDGVADALARYLRTLPRNEASALMPRDIHLATQLFPIFETVPAVRDVPRRQKSIADPHETRSRAFAAFKELVARVADKQPLVIVIDDLQWSDVDSARLLAQLVAPPERPALLLVLAYRAGDADQGATLRETLRLLDAAGDPGETLPLGALGSADAERLAGSLLGDGERSRDAARAIALRAEGHPLFVAELARELALGGVVEAPSLMDVLWQRVLRLGESARALLETVAVAGQPLPSTLCFEAAGLGGNGIEAVRALRAAQLVRTGDGGIIHVFHDRVRDTVLARADAATRRMRHLALARTLERRPDPDHEALARHFDAAEEHERAARYALSAADAAVRALAFDRAADLYQMAIDRRHGDVPPSLYEKLGDALLNAGSSAAAGQAYLDAAERADGVLLTDLKRRAAEQLLSRGDFDAGNEALADAFDAVGEHMPSSRTAAMCEMLYHTAIVRLRGHRVRRRDGANTAPEELLRLDVLDSAIQALHANRPVHALAISARFARSALASGDARRAALGLTEAAMGFVGGSAARSPRIDELLDRAEEMGKELSDPDVLARAAVTRGFSLFCFSEFQPAAAVCERASTFITERCVGMSNLFHNAAWVAATSRVRAGRLSGAARMAEPLLLDAIERANPVIEKSLCASVMTPLRLAAGDPKGAHEVLMRVGLEDRCVSAMFRAEGAAAIALYEGRAQDAVSAWRALWDKIVDYGVLFVPGWRTIVARSLGVALLVAPESRREIREAARLARSIRRFPFPHAVAVHTTLRAYLALHDGRPDRAAAFLADSARSYDEAEMRLEAAACRRRHGALVGDREEIAAADDTLRAHGVAEPDRWTAMMFPEIRPLASRRALALPS